MIRAMALYAEAEAVSATEPQHALQLFAEARELARTTGNRLVLGVAMVAETALLGRVGALDTETVNRTADAVRFWLGSGNENLFVTCLRNVVSLLDRLDAHRAVVELVATTTTRTPDRPPYGVEAEAPGRGHGPGPRGAGTCGVRRRLARRRRPRPGRRGSRGRRRC